MHPLLKQHIFGIHPFTLMLQRITVSKQKTCEHSAKVALEQLKLKRNMVKEATLQSDER
jgi:hypothetical protein